MEGSFFAQGRGPYQVNSAPPCAVTMLPAVAHGCCDAAGGVPLDDWDDSSRDRGGDVAAAGACMHMPILKSKLYTHVPQDGGPHAAIGVA